MMRRFYLFMCVMLLSVVGFSESMAEDVPFADGILIDSFVSGLGGTAFCKVHSRNKCRDFFVKTAPITKDDKRSVGLQIRLPLGEEKLYPSDYEIYPNGESCDELSCTVFLMYSDYESISVDVPQGKSVQILRRSLEENWKDVRSSTEGRSDFPDLLNLSEHTPVSLQLHTYKCKTTWEWNGSRYEQHERGECSRD